MVAFARPSKCQAKLALLAVQALCVVGASSLSANASPGQEQPMDLVRGETHSIRTAHELKAAVGRANREKNARTLLLEAGTYLVEAPGLEIQCPGLVIRSAGGNRAEVIVRGPDAGTNASVSDVFLVSANDVVIADLTLGYCRFHGIQLRADPPFHSCVLPLHTS